MRAAPADRIRLRLVPVEILRAGPPHNQLLSSLTQYLCICGDAGAGALNVPYEHSRFERRLKELRYQTGDPEDRLAVLHEIGTEMGRLLGSIPGLAGAIAADPGRPGTLIHLRITLSASELALLPFELAKAPSGPDATAHTWLAVQSRPPVCITRSIRSVSPESVSWPAAPRILFVSADPREVPFQAHRAALLQAIAPFSHDALLDASSDAPPPAEAGGVRREQFGDLLTVLVDPTLGDLLEECRTAAYTHVHVLAHGDADPSSPGAFGLVLRDASGSADIVSGERLAGALTSLVDGRIQRPAVVTVASCESASVGTVIVPGASVAHALHQAGIPLVIASQFPLSKDGSIPLASTLYPALLRGEHPLLATQRLRSELHARYTATWHDWASLVVYEALPLAMDDSLEALRYAQARRGIEAALGRTDRAARAGRPDAPRVQELVADVDAAIARLPGEGPFAAESMGLRASAHKRLAQLVFAIDRAGLGADGARPDAGAGGSGFRTDTARLPDPYDLLEQSLREYEVTSRKFLTNDADAVQRIATLHWVLVQVISLHVVLGRPVDAGLVQAARVAADTYLTHADLDAQAWAHGSLAELALLRLAAPEIDAAARCAEHDRALDHLRSLLRLTPGRDAFVLTSTLRQLARYVEWWGSAAFAEGLAARTGVVRPSWDGEHGLLACAADALRLLERRRRAVRPVVSEGRERADTVLSLAAAGDGPGRPIAGDDRQAGTDDPAAPAPPTLAKPAPSGGRQAFLNVHLLPAGHGDCVWIEYGRGRQLHRWLVDCGTPATAPLLLERAGALAPRERLELFVLSHIDADHIGGALPFFQAVQRGVRFGDVWFNGWRHLGGQLGARQGEMFSTAIQDFRLPWNRWRDGEAVAIDGDAGSLPEHVLPGGMRLTLLSPTPRELRRLAPVWARELKRAGLVPGSRVDYGRFLEGTRTSSNDVEALAAAPFDPDTGAPNGTSIALLAEYEGAAVLLAADAHAPVLASSIRRLLAERRVNRLKVDVFKVSHHGSGRNVSVELLQLLECPRYLISTNGDHFAHPDREAIARIIRHGGPSPRLVFNYRSEANQVWANAALQERHGYTATYPAADEPGIVVRLI